MDIIPVVLDSFLRFFEHDKKHGFLIVVPTILTNWSVRGSVESLKSQCGRHHNLRDRDAKVLARYVRDDRKQPLSELSSLLNVSRNTTKSFT
jgi:hypothetical protein